MEKSDHGSRVTISLCCGCPFNSFSPIFLWGYLLAGGALNATLLIAYLSFHLFLYAGGTALNSYYDRDEGPVGGLANPPPPPKYLLEFSLVWQLVGFLLALYVNLTVACHLFRHVLDVYRLFTPAHPLEGQTGSGACYNHAGQGILPFYAGWATALGGLIGGGDVSAIVPALSATLIIGGMYPLTQIYQLDADAERGDLTAARFLGVENSFRVALASVAIGGAGAVDIAATQFSWLEGIGLAVFIVIVLVAIVRWRSAFYAQTVMQNFKTLMLLYAGVTLPFLVWIVFHLALVTLA